MHVLYKCGNRGRTIPHFEQDGHRWVATKPLTREELVEAAQAAVGKRLDVYKYKYQVLGEGVVSTGKRTDKVDLQADKAVPPLVDWFQFYYDRLTVEALVAVFFKNNRLHEITEFARGSQTAVGFYPPLIVRHAVRLGADSVILVHNHPTADAQHSPADIKASRHVGLMLAAVDIHLDDSWVISPSNWGSIKQLGVAPSCYLDEYLRMVDDAAD